MISAKLRRMKYDSTNLDTDHWFPEKSKIDQ